MAKDVFHQQVKNALIKDGWNITHNPLTIRISEAVKLQIDLAAETTIAAERDSQKIAVEIKSFVGDSDISAFHTALGQYLNYSQALEEQEPDRIVFYTFEVAEFHNGLLGQILYGFFPHVLVFLLAFAWACSHVVVFEVCCFPVFVADHLMAVLMTFCCLNLY